jgi:cystathionine gamma-synthase/cystathionine gamma-lyase
MQFETRAIHDGQEPDAQTGAVNVPVYQTSTYLQDGIGRDRGFEYSRTGNPTRQALETALASLEGAKYGLAFASGVAATTAVLNLLKPGDHVVSGNDVYGGTFRLFEQVFRPWGLQTSYAEASDLEAFEREINDRTRMIWIETPTNPLLKVANIARLAEIAKERGLWIVVDNTFSSPYFQRPLEFGADAVVHSTTKYLSGHSDVIGGAILTSNAELHERLKFYQNAAGAVPGPWDAWLTLRGLKTLAVRMREHERNALRLASYLEENPAVERVYYPGLASHPQHDLASRQMSGYGGIVSFELAGGRPAVDRFLSRLQTIFLAESLGGVESLICYPPQMTHASMGEKGRAERGIKDNLLRLSVGLESVIDLENELSDALAFAAPGLPRAEPAATAGAR